MNKQTLIIGVLTVLVLGTGYWFFFSGPSVAPVTENAVGTPAEQQFLDLAGALSPVSFDTDIFSDPRFTSLVDITIPISPEPAGRIDPFAPLGR